MGKERNPTGCPFSKQGKNQKVSIESMREVTIRVLTHKSDSKGEISYFIDVVYWDISVVIPSVQQEAKHAKVSRER